jgi:hypothetical protein
MLFNLLTSWNLAAEMYEDRSLGLQLDPFVEKQITDGVTGKWLTPANKARALDTFVLAKQPLLPPGLDVRAQTFSDHLNWWSHVAPDLAMRTMGRYRPDEWFDLAPLISAGLASRGIEGDADHVRKMASQLQGMDENRRGGITDDYFRVVELEFAVAWLMCEFARRGVPTFGASRTPAGDPLQLTAGALDLVKFYFDNQVMVTAPRSFSEALDFRGNQRVPAWRQQISAWSEELATGKADFRQIKQQMDDANGYIQGSNLPTKLLPRGTAFFTLSAGTYEVLLADHHLAHLIGLGLWGVEIIRFVGETIRASTTSPDPLQYKWFLLANDSEKD